MITLISGGARSGKSKFANSLFDDKKDVVYIATSRIEDEEMRQRVEMHKEYRPDSWRTFEGSYSLDSAIGEEKNYLLDCITVLTFNILFDTTKDTENISHETQAEIEVKIFNELSILIEKAKSLNLNLALVTNEVGDSIVPDNHLGRVYRDILGRVNQKVAAICDEVYIVFCGLPMKLK